MIILTKHFKDRFRERYSRKTKFMRRITEQAYSYGKTIDKLDNDRQRAYLCDVETRHPESTAKIYHNYVFVFHEKVAITIYPLPSEVRTGYVSYCAYWRTNYERI